MIEQENKKPTPYADAFIEFQELLDELIDASKNIALNSDENKRLSFHDAQVKVMASYNKQLTKVQQYEKSMDSDK